MDEAEHDVLAYMAFPKSHWPQIHSTNPIERLNREIKRRTNVVSIFPNEAAIVRLVGAILLEQNDEWAVCRRYMSLETLAGLCDDPPSGRRPSRPPDTRATARSDHDSLLHHAPGALPDAGRMVNMNKARTALRLQLGAMPALTPTEVA